MYTIYKRNVRFDGIFGEHFNRWLLDIRYSFIYNLISKEVSIPIGSLKLKCSAEGKE